MTTRKLTYRIERVTWLGPENAPIRYYKVYSGDDSRDYVMRDYRPMREVGTFATREQAESFVKESTT